MITIVDYGSGNIEAFVNIYKRLNIPCEVATKPEQILKAKKIQKKAAKKGFDWRESIDVIEKVEEELTFESLLKTFILPCCSTTNILFEPSPA